MYLMFRRSGVVSLALYRFLSERVCPSVCNAVLWTVYPFYTHEEAGPGATGTKMWKFKYSDIPDILEYSTARANSTERSRAM